MTLDSVSQFIAEYLSWARQVRFYGTLIPVHCYRGHNSEKEMKLLPTLCRQGQPLVYLRQMEQEVIETFRNQFESELSGWTDVEVLAYARHHGAPTRLLDWSRNPFVGLWFAVSDKNYDSHTGIVFQLHLQIENRSSVMACWHTDKVQLDKLENANFNGKIIVFSSPPRVKRTERQQSVFTIVSFNDSEFQKPLDERGSKELPAPIRKFLIRPEIKPELRRVLAELGLDAYSIYGDPDSFGKKITAAFDLSSLVVSQGVPPKFETRTGGAN